MKYLGDYTEDCATLNFKFSTHKADGTPATLSGTPAVSVYKANNTTQSTAGVTLSVDFDSITGLNNVLIDLSSDAFYAVANDYQVVITTGTVDSISVIGTVIAEFSIENRSTSTIASDVWEETISAHSSGSGKKATELTDALGYASAIRTGLTDARMGYMDKLNITGDVAGSAEISALNDFDPSSDVVAHVTLVDTCTTNTDMRGTDSALLAANYTAPNNSGITDIKTKTDQLTFTTLNKVDSTATISTTGLATEENQTLIRSDIASVVTHGDSAWITGGGLSGSNAITINVHDGDGLNILGASIEMWDSVGTSFYEKKFSNSSGQAVFNMDSGTYTVKISKPGYSFADTALTITTTASVTYTITAYVIGTPAASGLCRIYTYVFNPDGTKFSSVTSTATISLVDKNDNNFYSGTVTGTYNITTGLLYWDIIQGGKANISVSEIGLNKNILVPNSITAKLDDLE